MGRSGPAVCVVALLLAGGLQAQTHRLDDALQERAHVQLRSVRLRIQPASEARAGECLELGPGDLRISVGGDVLPPAHLLDLERRREPTIHALLIDTSGSMVDRLDVIRQTATEYLDRLRPDHEKALLVSFDETPILLQRATNDMARLHAAVRQIQPGVMTTLLDGLYNVIRELDGHRERPVVILVTDGVDTTSAHERFEINDLVERRPDLTVFVIGVKLPPLLSGRPGLLSTKRFLQRLTRRTNGRFFDDMTGSRLAREFDRIRELLDNEAVLTFVDPEPNARRQEVKIRSSNPACRVRAFRSAPPREIAPRRRPIPRPFVDSPWSFDLAPSQAYSKYYELDGRGAVDPDCAQGALAGSPWFVEVGDEGLTGCSLDITMDTGLLYSTLESGRLAVNDFLMQKTRPFRVALPRVSELPRRPEQLMDGLAEVALSLADAPVELDSRKLPEALHARPYHDVPLLVHGQTFLEIRPRLARAQFARPDYREWVLDRIGRDARREMEELKARFDRLAPGRTDAQLEQAVRLSEEGAAIRLRAETPSEVDLQRYLAAWLGDISASELFARWEIERANRWLRDPGSSTSLDAFLGPWRGARKLFFVPSHARTLTLLSAVHDRELDAVGYWRVVLPRPGWQRLRTQATRRSPDWYHVPLDLVPDLPFGFWLLDRLASEQAGLVEHLRHEGYRVADIAYELLAKPYRQDPERAFRAARVLIDVRRDGGNRGRLLLSARLGIDKGAESPRLDHLELEVEGDEALERLARAAARIVRAPRRG